MITGDYPTTAKSIALQAGMVINELVFLGNLKGIYVCLINK
jgi:magnesium-transporting ATPase (P-type)